jgi:hypothetical protein
LKVAGQPGHFVEVFARMKWLAQSETYRLGKAEERTGCIGAAAESCGNWPKRGGIDAVTQSARPARFRQASRIAGEDVRLNRRGILSLARWRVGGTRRRPM